MSAVTGKRKREDLPSKLKKSQKVVRAPSTNGKYTNVKPTPTNGAQQTEIDGTTSTASQPISSDHTTVQIVTGSYERVLHGIAAKVSLNSTSTTPTGTDEATFADTFLFAAHASSIRCLAISPPAGSAKRLLATGSSDERVNVYSISTVANTAATGTSDTLAPPPLLGTVIAEDSRNRSLGALVHHDRAITCLEFPTRAKLFSAAEDNTIAISRTRDWTMLSSIKAPIPKAQGRPSGDTAAPGEVPSGVNGFAIHPSQKLMLSVSRREKCMRLWNLMTGKKAGVLNFDRDLLTQVGEGKYGSGEGRRVLWDPSGENYVVGFERGAAVFGIDSKPKAVIKGSPMVKLHQIHFVSSSADPGAASTLAVSTEDGRILFFDLSHADGEPDPAKLPLCMCIAQLGGAAAGISGRVKDFEVVPLPSSGATPGAFLVVTGSSDGAVRLWTVSAAEMSGLNDATHSTMKPNGDASTSPQIGTLVGTLETGSRITCLGAFIMDGDSGAAKEDEEVNGEASDDDESSD